MYKRVELGSFHYRMPILVPQGSSFPLPKADEVVEHIPGEAQRFFPVKYLFGEANIA